ncbi:MULTISPECIES: hypothetical protein [Mucilaginibacter]|uniref:Uncharacterized protein n=1 Tax=Mucilaginibacter rubeus TaxID=2027860 RepID=A0ABX7UQD0_9SPHI|nr:MULTISPECIES: hypothetical protein [Mucilaginibacter]QTE46864.1 hypothetical protein J3L19_16355 [Mucilaginibacter rubeus]QTE53462.1 hypothetical protein J3L21_16335 [Mucilaginibacter rubeus]QTE61993.1 hypothetical protein J3L22_25860 [Mucilaginibacter rubeus]
MKEIVHSSDGLQRREGAAAGIGYREQRAGITHPVTVGVKDVFARVHFVSEVVGYRLRYFRSAGVEAMNDYGFHGNGLIEAFEMFLVEPGLLPEFELAKICHV